MHLTWSALNLLRTAWRIFIASEPKLLEISSTLTTSCYFLWFSVFFYFIFFFISKIHKAGHEVELFIFLLFDFTLFFELLQDGHDMPMSVPGSIIYYSLFVSKTNKSLVNLNKFLFKFNFFIVLELWNLPLILTWRMPSKS